jgi:hypothetical protein
LRDVGRSLPKRLSHRIEVAPSDNKSFIVECDATPKPLGSRGCSSHDEDVTNIMTGSLAANFVLPCDAFEAFVTVQANKFCLVVQFDGRVGFNPLD